MTHIPNGSLHKALTQFSSAVLTMQSPEDLERLVVAMWAELNTLGLTVGYCGINVIDEQASQFHFYGIHNRGLIVAERISLSFGMLHGKDLPDHESFLRFLNTELACQYTLSRSELLRWLQDLRSKFPVKGPDPQPPVESFRVLEVPFKFGTIQLAREPGSSFDDGSVEITRSFAQILSFGYARYADLQKLEGQNRELKVKLAVDRVHVAVMVMKQSEDWGQVVNVMRKELLDLGVRLVGCSINIIDEDVNKFRQHIILPSRVRTTFKPKQNFQAIDDETDLFILERPMEEGRVPSDEAMAAWKERRVWRRALDEESRRQVAERSRGSMGFEISPADEYPSCLLDVPFSHGLIALGARDPNDLGNAEIAIVQQMAQAISVAHSRLLDFQALERKNRQLSEAQSQLVQTAKLAAMGQLVAGVAHEINTPLGTINSNFDVTTRALKKVREELQGKAGGIPDNLQKLFETIDPLMDLNRLACQRIIRIVRDLRNFARLDEAEFKETDVRADIESTLTLIQHEIRDRIEVKKDFGDVPPLPCYPNRLNQVFMNLLMNACQSISGKGEIQIATTSSNGEVRIAITDTGKGIKAEHLSKIFDPGFTTKGVGVGTGLGLSISSRIIEDHGGRIEVKSHEGEGTTFTVALPLKPPKPSS